MNNQKKPQAAATAKGEPKSNAQTQEERYIKYTSKTQIDELPTNIEEAAQWWLKFGLNPIPIESNEKNTVRKWQPWLDKLSENSIKWHWDNNPTNDLGAILDHRLLVLDADTPESLAALYKIEAEHGLHPNLIVKTKKGEHHFFKRATETYAYQCGYSGKLEPKKIDVKTGRTETEGRSMVILAPSTDKSIKHRTANNIDELTEVDQAFIDAVFMHNGKKPPRLPEPKVIQEYTGRAGKHEVAEILSHIKADLDYTDWLTVLMGVHEHFNGAEIGLLIVDEWSAKAANYAGTEVIENKWRSFTLDGGVTFGSVCHMAQLAGADLAKIKKQFDENGDPLPTYEELLALAKDFDKETPPSVIQNIVKSTVSLDALERRRIFEMIKKKTAVTMGVLHDAFNESKPDALSDDHLLLAKSVIGHVGAANIMAANTFVWGWDDCGVWRQLEDRSVKQTVQNHIPEITEAITRNLIDGVTDVFKTDIFKPFHEFNIGEAESVNCLNGELELHDFIGEWTLTGHVREHYRTTQIPINFDEDATAPMFEKFMHDIFEGDADYVEKKTAVLEMMGYTLMAHCRHERFAILIGSGANGKSVLLAVIEALCGAENVAGVQPSSFNNRFQRAYLNGKLANIVTEIEQGEVIADAALKGIVSGEPSTVENKNKDPFTLRPFCTCWFGTNHMPHTRDFSDALFRRALVVTFNNTFKPELGNCDPLMKDKLFNELDGILNLSLKSYANAVVNGFTTPPSSEEARKEWRLEADQVQQFIEEVCEVEPLSEVTIGDLFLEYKDWADKNGISRQLSKKGFRDRLNRLSFGERRTALARYVVGLKLPVEKNSSYSSFDIK